MKALLPLTLLLATTSCVPSLDHLVASRRYADAICQVRSQSEAERVTRAIERDAEPRVHVYTVHEEELSRALGDKGRELARSTVFVRVKTASNPLPPMGGLLVGGPRFGLPDAAPTGSLRPFSPPPVMDVSGRISPSGEAGNFLFALSGETLPGPGSYVDPAALMREVAWGTFTLGFKQLLFGSEKIVHEALPGRDDFLHAGPVAMTLFDGLNRPGNVRAFALARTFESPSTLSLGLVFATTDEDLASCRLHVHYESLLSPRVQDLAAATDARFADGPHPAFEPGVTRSFALSNRFGTWSSPRLAP